MYISAPAYLPDPLFDFSEGLVPRLDLTHDELDLVVMGQVMAGCFSADTFRKQEK